MAIHSPHKLAITPVFSTNSGEARYSILLCRICDPTWSNQAAWMPVSLTMQSKVWGNCKLVVLGYQLMSCKHDTCLYVVKNPCSYLWVCSVCHVYTQELRDQAILSLHAELKCSVAFTIIYMYIFSSRVYYNYSMCIYAPRTLVHWMLSLPLVVRASTVRTVTATSTAMFSHTGATGCFLGWLQNKQCVRVGSAVALK